MMSKLVDHLAQKIKKDIGVDVEPDTFISIRPRGADKLAGAWSWSMDIKDSASLRKVGSAYTATQCTRKNIKLYRVDQHPGIRHNDIEVVPDEVPAPIPDSPNNTCKQT